MLEAVDTLVDKDALLNASACVWTSRSCAADAYSSSQCGAMLCCLLCEDNSDRPAARLPQLLSFLPHTAESLVLAPVQDSPLMPAMVSSTSRFLMPSIAISNTWLHSSPSPSHRSDTSTQPLGSAPSTRRADSTSRGVTIGSCSCRISISIGVSRV